jgi:hypothetical protein
MVRSTAYSWKIGLAVAALALPLGQLQALADDGLSETPETRSQPLEPKVVPVILLPPASDAVFAPQRPALVEDVPIIMVQPARNRPITQLRAEPVKIREDAIIREDAKFQQDATLEESSSTPEPPPRVALLPPVGNAAIASRSEPEETRNDVTPVVIPALPGRSPFRQNPFKSEIVENAPIDTASVQQQASEPFPASIEQAEADPESDKPPIKRFLDGLQFWKN